MATQIKTADSVALRGSFSGGYNQMPTGKEIDELWAELGITVPTQTVAHSSFTAVHLSPTGKKILIWTIGNSADNEYLVLVPLDHVKNLIMKLKASA